MSKSLGIIAEYNPFHNGHKYHLEKSLEITGAQVSVAVISGNFTQRGEFACMDKWQRSEIAVRNGVNLVVEMPSVFACNNAGYFGAKGVEILENLGVDYISFGSESGDLALLKEVAAAMKSREKEIEEAVKNLLKDGFSYPRARQKVLENILDKEKIAVLESPNNLLALEYLKNMEHAQPITVERKGAGYLDLTAKEGIASATGLREMVSENVPIQDFISRDTECIIKGNSTTFLQPEDMFQWILGRAIKASAEELNQVFGGEEGLGNKLKQEFRKVKSYDELVDVLKSKRYTRTRIARYLAHVMLDIKREDILNARNYIRVLAFDETGSKYLKAVKKSGKCSLPIITNINKDLGKYPEIEKTLEKDILAADIYNFQRGVDLYSYSEFVKKPLKL